MSRNPASGPRKRRGPKVTHLALNPDATGFGSTKIISKAEFEERQRQGMPVRRIVR